MRVVRSMLFAVVLVLTAASAWAQTDVAFFLAPKLGTGQYPDAFRPKYTDPGSLGAGNDLTGWVAMDYGFESAFLVVAPVTAAQRTALSAQADTLVVPANLDNTISALALSTIQTKLEALNLPGNWITSGMTYRQAVKGARRVISFMQRWQGLFGERLFGGTVTLDTRINQLTATQRQRLNTVAADLNLDTSGITNTTTLRQALKAIADQLPDVIVQGEAI